VTAVSLSIITVTLNSARHVRQAIESVLEQDVDNLQYIIIDGQSSDDTLAIIESYREAFGPRLLVVSEKDAGLYDAMNKGLALATGDVIGILNSDDRYQPGALAAVAEKFATEDADIVYGDVQMVADGESWISRGDASGMRRQMSIDHPGSFVHRAAYERWGRFDTKYRFAADYEFLLRCYLGNARFVRLDRVVARFEYGGKSSRSFDIRRREVFDIQARHLGLAQARWRQARVMVSVWISSWRRALGITLLGEDRYLRVIGALRRRRLNATSNQNSA
jgi:glycosyltransferase involved in cell wall biosynthesis